MLVEIDKVYKKDQEMQMLIDNSVNMILKRHLRH